MPIVALLTFGEEAALPDGTTPDSAAAALAGADADVLGVNCGAGPVAASTPWPRWARRRPAGRILPNAGLPQRIEGQFVYAAGPDYFGAMVDDMLAAGAAIVGGCCGTTPEHIAAMRTAIDVRAPAHRSARHRHRPAAVRRTPVAEGDAATGDGCRRRPAWRGPSPSGTLRHLGRDRPAALGPHRAHDRGRAPAPGGRRRRRQHQRFGDGPGADGALAVAFGIQHDLDLECVVHVTTRDRNLMALESELLGAHALGVRDILALTGDPPRIGDLPGATGVWDVDSIGLVEILTRLNRGEDAAGSPIGQRAGFTIACALDPTAADAATEWDRLERKIAAGAHLVMTQPLYSVEQVEAMFAEAERRFGPGGIPLPVLLGVLPLAELAPRGVPAQRGARHHHPRRGPGRAQGGRRARRRGRLTWRSSCSPPSDDRVAGTYVMPSSGATSRRRSSSAASEPVTQPRGCPPDPSESWPPPRPYRSTSRSPHRRFDRRRGRPFVAAHAAPPVRRSRRRSRARPCTTRPASSRR